jgi:hypothetical protein
MLQTADRPSTQQGKPLPTTTVKLYDTQSQVSQGSVAPGGGGASGVWHYSVADPDPGSGAFFTPDPGWKKIHSQDPG